MQNLNVACIPAGIPCGGCCNRGPCVGTRSLGAHYVGDPKRDHDLDDPTCVPGIFIQLEFKDQSCSILNVQEAISESPKSVRAMKSSMQLQGKQILASQLFLDSAGLLRATYGYPGSGD